MRFQAGQVHLIRLFAAMVGLALLVGRQMPAWSVDACPGEREVTMIVVELLQSGFAGQSGERTSIGEDGCFTVDRVLNDKVSRLRSGRLALDQILSVRAAIDIANIASLPNRAGESPVVNPTIVLVTYRGATKSLVMASGANLDDIAALGRGSREDPSARLARLAARLLQLTSS
jgi:hypothetical protein